VISLIQNSGFWLPAPTLSAILGTTDEPDTARWVALRSNEDENSTLQTQGYRSYMGAFLGPVTVSRVPQYFLVHSCPPHVLLIACVCPMFTSQLPSNGVYLELHEY
jgi:hypothetical protein